MNCFFQPFLQGLSTNTEREHQEVAGEIKYVGMTPNESRDTNLLPHVL